MKIGGTSYVEVGEGVVAEREVVRFVDSAVPVREVITLVAPVDTKHFDETVNAKMAEIVVHVAAIHDLLAGMGKNVRVIDAEQTTLATRFSKHTLKLESIERSLFALTNNWLFRLMRWIGERF